MSTRTGFDAERFATAFQRDGYSVHDGVISKDEVQSLRLAVASIPNREEVRKKKTVYGVRNLLEVCPAIRKLVRATLRDPLNTQSVSHMLHRLPPLRRAQKFPEVASRRIALSSSASASSRFQRAFSFSSSLSFLAWSTFKPPYSRRQR